MCFCNDVQSLLCELSVGREQEGLPLFEDIEGKVHIGNQQFLPSEKWQHLLRLPRDSLFCKEGARSLWTVSDLKERTLTGMPCRRFLNSKEGPPAKKTAMTPQKVEALGWAFDHYIVSHPMEAQSPGSRRKKLNYFLGELVQDIRKK